jgi:hypothetical protein
LVLNKILCGVPVSTPLDRDFVVTKVERETTDSLLATMINRWSIIGSTSVAGLRETFLQRRGMLVEEEQQWRLRVEQRPFDMLIDQLPWGFRTQKLPWMEKVLHVDWR